VSLRPRFAGDGLLRLPSKVTVGRLQYGLTDVLAYGGTLGDETYDPFERVASGLLLAEDFARLDLGQTRELMDWFRRHGALDLDHFLPPDPLSDAPVVAPPAFRDAARDIEAQQRNVAWHLLSLARLSEYLQPVSMPDDDEGPMWNPAWAQPALVVGRDVLWLGGQNRYARHIGPGMRESPEPPPGSGVPEMTDGQYRDWWRQAHVSWLHIVETDVPLLWVPAPALRYPTWEAQAALDDPVDQALGDGLGSDPWSLVELMRRLMAPYVSRAGEHRVEVDWPSFPAPGDQQDAPLVIRERRTWSSLLAPVYVQLLEGLRRVTESQRGAAFCRECGQPFLVLDARRSTFCTDRERLRYGQRMHRLRVAEQAAERYGATVLDPEDAEDLRAAARLSTEEADPEDFGPEDCGPEDFEPEDREP
jgi:hypothetical protein